MITLDPKRAPVPDLIHINHNVRKKLVVANTTCNPSSKLVAFDPEWETFR